MSAIDGRLPTSEDYDYKSEAKGADMIIISFNDSFFQRNPSGNKILFMIGVKALTNDTSYQLMNWALSSSVPQSLNYRAIPFKDLSLGKAYTEIFAPRKTKPDL